ncbi:tpa inducible [Fusarium longipes]|uniref:Tpa inducible n=1 Tax=Fusarium longipes TaxID=694270 RepID=A0A395RTB6_9HYPO|nr:tpa inducible [Fusarium longipes]
MNQSAAYTPLESLFLFQSLLTQGADPGAFARISEQLKDNPLIKEGATYDPVRLKPDALQHLFLRLFGEELRGDSEKDTTDDPAASPNTQRRTLEGTPLPTFKDVYDNAEKVHSLIQRLWQQYSAKTVGHIREDEQKIDALQKDIHFLERTARERRARAASQNGTPVLAARDQKASIPPNGQTPPPTATTSTATPVRKGPTPQTPVLPPKPPVSLNNQPSVAPPSHLPAGTTPIRPSPSPNPPSANGSVLQPPPGVPPTGPRSLQTPQAPKQTLTPRPEAGAKPKDGSAVPQSSSPVGAPLKWEKPYQPPQATQTPPPRHFQSPLAQGPIAPPPTQQHQQQQQYSQSHAQYPQQAPQQQQQWYPQQSAQLSPKPGAQPLSSHSQTPQHAQVQPRPQPVAPQPPQIQQQGQQAQSQQQQRPQPHQVVQPSQQPPRTPQAQHTTPIQHTQQIQKPHTPTPAQLAQAQQSQQVPIPQPSISSQQQQYKPRPTPAKPGLAPPQHAGQIPPPLQPAPPRPSVDLSGGQTLQARPSSTTPVPHPRPIQPPQSQAQQVRPIVSASPTPPVGNASPIAPPHQRRPSGYQPQPPQHASPAGSSAPQVSKVENKNQASQNIAQHQVPGALGHIIRQVLSTPVKRLATPPAPRTPTSTSAHLLQGFGTKWAPQSTPSTPGPAHMNAAPQSPAFEPVSPPSKNATLPSSAASTPKPKKQAPKAVPKLEQSVSKSVRGRSSRASQRARGVSSTPSVSRSRRSQSVMSHTDEQATQTSETAPRIKDEDATPRPTEETGDTTADESVPGRPQIMTPGSVSSRLQKRKRQGTPPDLPPETTQVLWTRGFTKVSSSALDQISSHRDANMFATRLREKDAPNYRQIVLQPQDITSIRSAIKHGNKAAVQAAANLPSGDPGTAHVWLPMSEELVPPKGIINSAQLERELVHMFCNAIMYNADPDRGPGPAFMKRSQEEEEEIVGYRLDENGVVKNTRSMFVEVEKLLGDLRSAEKERSAPPPSARPASVATPAEETGDDDDDNGEREIGTSKRRRIGGRG